MPRKALPPAEVDPERERQLEEGRRRAAEEEAFETGTHGSVRHDLYAASSVAVNALRSEMEKGGRSAVSAALGVLDRTGHPPVRKVETEDRQAPRGDRAIEDAIRGLLEVPEEILLGLFARMLQARPDLIQAAQAAPPLQLEAEVVEDEPQEPEPDEEPLGGPSAAELLESMRFRVDDESILPAGELDQP